MERSRRRSLQGLSTAALLVCLSVLPDTAPAQQRPRLTGVVTEAVTRTPVVGARVSIIELRRDDATHEDGRFDFPNIPPGNYTLRVTRIGMSPVTHMVSVRGDSTTTVAIPMAAAVVHLEATVSTGTIVAKSAQDVITPTSVVAGADLDRRLESTLAATLKDMPGVSISTLGPATAHPVIRGLSGDRVVVLEDGARAGDMSNTGSDHAVTVEPLGVKQFEVVRGPMSLLYGSSALGGVVNAIREEVPSSRSEHVTGTLNIEATSVDRGLSGGGFAMASRGKLSVRGESTVRRTGDQHTPAGVLDNSDSRTYSLAAGAARVADNGYAGVSYRYFNNAYGVPGGFVGGHDAGVTIDMHRHMSRAESELRRDIGPISSIKATGTFTKYGHQETEAGGSLGTSFDQDVAAVEVIARGGGTDQQRQTALGVRWQHRDIQTGGSLRTPSTYDNTGAIFLVQELSVGRVRLQGGARYDGARYVPYARNNGILVNGRLIPTGPRSFGSVSGSFGSLVDVGGGVRVGASVARAYRTPDFNELYSNGPHLAAFSFEVGNPELKQETGVGVDVFARLSRDRVHGEVALFRNAMSDFVYSRNTGDIGLQGNRPKFQFTGRDAVLSGGEGSLEVDVAQHTSIEGMFSVVRGRFPGAVDSLPADSAHGIFQPRAGSHHLPMMPPPSGRVGVRYDAPRYFGGAGVRLVARQDRLGDFETETAGYAVADLNIGMRVLRGHRFHAITLRADNLFDTTYRNHLSRTKDVRPEAGRNIALVYRLTY